VCPGGANKGAYQAGAIAGLAEREGRHDGEPLDFDLVTGASSGAINAYFTATARYSSLRAFWHDFPRSHALRVKPRYARTTGSAELRDARLRKRVELLARDLLGRGVAGLRLLVALLLNQKGILDASAAGTLIDKYFDARTPIHIPLYLAATSITRQERVLFLAAPTTPDGLRRHASNATMLVSLDRPRIVEVNGALLGRALFASAALPILFDPVIMTVPTSPGISEEFVDGGLIDNAPVEAARCAAASLHVIDVDPPEQPGGRHVRYRDAIDVAVGVYNTIQRRMSEQQVELLAADIAARRRRAAADSAEAADAAGRLHLIRPVSALPGKYMDFFDQQSFDKAFEIGRRDGLRGWEPYRLV
jgi:predicted acylesterase/phospholipase RssA